MSEQQSPQRNRPSFLSRLRERTGNPLEWTQVERALLVAAVGLVLSIPVLVLSTTAAHTFAIRSYINLEVFPMVPIAVGSWCLILAFTVLWGLWLRRHSSESRFYPHFVAQGGAVMMSVFCYGLGAATHPIMVVALASAILFLLLFEVHIVLPAVAVFFTLIMGSSVMILLGWIPYAPVLKHIPAGEGHIDPFYFMTTFMLAVVTSVIMFVLITYIVIRWRGREDQLARAYKELSETKDQLVRAESLAALGSLVTGAAHELKNPLASSSALFQSLRDEIDGTENLTGEQRRDFSETINMALKGQKRAAMIAERLHSLSDALASALQKRPLKNVMETLQGRYPGARITLSAEAGAVLVSERTVLTIFGNLLDNAGAAGGEAPPVLEVGTRGGVLLASVQDLGRGIAPADQPHVFEPFFTGQKAGEGHGVGLGLYIVHELTARVGGSITLDSQPGRGTRVTVLLPTEQDT